VEDTGDFCIFVFSESSMHPEVLSICPAKQVVPVAREGVLPEAEERPAEAEGREATEVSWSYVTRQDLRPRFLRLIREVQGAAEPAALIISIRPM